MSTLEEQSNFNESNIFKALEMSIYAKVYEPGDEQITTVFDEDGIVVPEDYTHIGLTSKDDGATWTRETSNADTTSHGRGEPTRRDVTEDVSGLQVTAQESKRIVMELFWSQTIAARATADGKGIYWDKQNRPSTRYVSILGVAKDGDGENAVYCARWLPRALLDEGNEQTWSEEDAVAYQLSFTAFNESRAGTALREIWGGPGFDAEARGFDDVEGIDDGDNGSGDESGE